MDQFTLCHDNDYMWHFATLTLLQSVESSPRVDISAESYPRGVG